MNKVIKMAKFKILATGNIAGLKKRYKAGYYETQDENEIRVLSKNKAAAMLIEEAKPEHIEVIEVAIPSEIKVAAPVKEIKKAKEVNPRGKHNHKAK